MRDGTAKIFLTSPVAPAAASCRLTRNAPDRLREMLAAVAVYAVGGEALLKQQQKTLPGAAMLLKHLGHQPEIERADLNSAISRKNSKMAEDHVLPVFSAR